MEVLLIRHGDPDYANDSLTRRGFEEARQLADGLSRVDDCCGSDRSIMTRWLYLHSLLPRRMRNGPPRYGLRSVAINGGPCGGIRTLMRRFAAIGVGAVCATISLYGAALAADDETVIVALGDSLTAGYGVVASDSFTVRLEAALLELRSERGRMPRGGMLRGTMPPMRGTDT